MLNWYAHHKELVWVLAIVVPVLFCLLHYRLIGPHRTSETVPYDNVVRFTGWERILHWISLVLFLIMIITGMAQVFGGQGPHMIGPIHGNLGRLLTLVGVLILIAWSRSTVFKNYDIVWMRSMGGYLSRSSVSLPAGRFNAGQKMYFWLMIFSIAFLVISAILMEQGGHGPHTLADRQSAYWSIHGLVGCIATAMVIGHAYLSLLANPQTARVLWDGRVSREYAEEYHSKWNF